MENHFDPEKYGMLFCIECNGNGKLLNDSEDIEVCPKCGGFGFVKKEEDQNRARDRKSLIDKRQKTDLDCSRSFSFPEGRGKK